MRARRLPHNPIVRPGMDERTGSNINGPSLIRTPDWLEGALGRYYLYFADHKGDYIRLAYAGALSEPWTVYAPGTLQLRESHFPTRPTQIATWAGPPHIASPDVHVDDERGEIRMYFHGVLADGRQCTRVALSRDGLHFEARPELLAAPYLRAFRFADVWYGMAMPGIVYRSADGLSGFEEAPQLFPDDMRHAALLRRGRELLVFWTRVGDAPERILCSRIALDGDWRHWKPSAPEDVLAPQETWEGSDLPLVASVRGLASEPVRQLRDPAIFEENGREYLLYAVAGERGIAIAELEIA